MVDRANSKRTARRGKPLAIAVVMLLALEVLAWFLVDMNGCLPFLNEQQSTIVAFLIFGGFVASVIALVILDRRYWLFAALGGLITVVLLAPVIAPILEYIWILLRGYP